MLASLIKQFITPESMAAANNSLATELSKYPLEAGELGPVIAITPGENQPKVQYITLQEREFPNPENADEPIRAVVYGRVLDSKNLMDVVSSLMPK